MSLFALDQDRSATYKHRLRLYFSEAALIALFLLPFTLLELWHVRDIITVRNPDFFPITKWALALKIGEWEPWINWQYPAGYPVLLRLGMSLGLSSLRVGQGLSILGGILALLSIYWLSKKLTHDRLIAWFSAAFLSTSSVFLRFSNYEGMDMLSAGLQLFALTILVQGEQRRGATFVAGVLAGLAYMVRYTGQITAALCVLYLLIAAILDRQKPRWVALAAYVIGFLLAAGPQLALSTAVVGTPFYSDQGRGVWFHITGKHDFVNEWAQAPQGVTVLQVFAQDSRRFISYWWNTFSSFWLKPVGLLLDAPLTLLSQAGMLFTWLAGRRIRSAHRLLLSGFVLAHLAVLGLMRMDPRFLIIVLPFMTWGSVYFLWAVVPQQLCTRWAGLPLNKIVLAGALLWTILVPVNFARDAPQPDTSVIEPSNMLHAAGMRSAQEVVSTAIPLHDVASPTRRRFDQLYWTEPDINSEDELLSFVRSAGYRFILYDADTGRRAFPGLIELLTPGRRPVPGFTPLHIAQDKSYAIYRVEPDTPAPEHRLEAQLEQDITLLGYDMYLSQDQPRGSGYRLGLYLYWQNQGNILANCKVSIQVLNSSGQLIAQHDGIPAQWTSPTPTWQPGKTVIDFHAVQLGSNLPPGDYTVLAVMYGETDGKRLALIDDSGRQSDDKIIIEHIALETD